MGFKCGIVGLPNVGKSTLFNALTATAAAEAANYPFCTIEPNVGRVGVPDNRLYELARIAGSGKIIPTQLEFVDIAGLVRGASRGEGLGNQFLGHIREVDAIVHVVRCFEDSDITHVEGEIHPIRDIDIIETELMLADLESLEKRMPALEKKLRLKDPQALIQYPLMERALNLLKEGKPARFVQCAPEEKIELQRLQLITTKPILYVCNVAENEARTGNRFTELVKERAAKEEARSVLISAAIEAEVASLESEEEKVEFLESLGLHETGLARVIREGHSLLNLITFFTIGPKEAHAWTVEKGAKAPQAAGEIHTDFERGFICAETISYEDYVAFQGEQGSKAAGKLRLEGRDYVVQDGDIFHFRFNV
ncbi:MAG: redox-regulated ATPase YchF [Alphaproteobacteria bacterium]|nr:redox-regulated ATPase YchF [Alphaproteobacteria bacterium]